MAQFNLDDYEPVEDRIPKFYKDHPEGRILTKIHEDDGTKIIIKAYLYKNNDDVVWTTGYAEEIRGEGYVNKTSAVENCETSAIGRALANANYAGSKRPSREEMAKVQRGNTLPRSTTGVAATADSITEAQRRKIFITLKNNGITEEDDQKLAIKELTGKESTADLTKAEASKVIKAFEA